MSGLVLNELGGVDKKYFMLPGDEYSNQIVAKFTYRQIINENESNRLGTLVSKVEAVCEIRTAQDPNSVLVKRPEEMFRRINGRLVTYGEAFSEPYQAFLNGDEQYAVGTPIEELNRFGATPQHISMARAQNILTLEALDNLQGKVRKGMGTIYTDLMEMLNKWKVAKAAADGTDVLESKKRVAELEARIAQLEGGAPKHEAEAASDIPEGDPYPDMTDADLRALIKERQDGVGVKGNPSRANLIQMLEG